MQPADLPDSAKNRSGGSRTEGSKGSKSLLGPQAAPVCQGTCFNSKQTAKRHKNPLWTALLGIVRGLNRAEGTGMRCIFKAPQFISNCWHPASQERQQGWRPGATAAAPIAKSLHGRQSSQPSPTHSSGLRNEILHLKNEILQLRMHLEWLINKLTVYQKGFCLFTNLLSFVLSGER